MVVVVVVVVVVGGSDVCLNSGEFLLTTARMQPILGPVDVVPCPAPVCRAPSLPKGHPVPESLAHVRDLVDHKDVNMHVHSGQGVNLGIRRPPSRGRLCKCD